MKRIIVTGTSRGIGFELVKIFAEAGHQVMALSRNPRPVQDLNYKNVKSIAFDITKEEDLKHVQNQVEKTSGQLDILVHNAGAIVNKAFDQLDQDDFQKVYATNVLGVAALTRSLLGFMGTTAHVVTVSSMGGVQGSAKFPGLSAYSSSKAAVTGLMEVLAEEYKERGPAFNVLALGAVQTEMLEEAFPGYKAPLQPQEMAQYIADFSLKANRFYNGKVLQVSKSTP